MCVNKIKNRDSTNMFPMIQAILDSRMFLGQWPFEQEIVLRTLTVY